jgi:hypothetical protein
MNRGQTVFSQLIEHLPHKEFQKCVARYSGDHALKSFSCWNQFLAMAFAQLTYRESLRDIEACLRSMQSKLYHMGFRGKVSRSTLADANEFRDWRIYADFAQVLIHSPPQAHTRFWLCADRSPRLGCSSALMSTSAQGYRPAPEARGPSKTDDTHSRFAVTRLVLAVTVHLSPRAWVVAAPMRFANLTHYSTLVLVRCPLNLTLADIA